LCLSVLFVGGGLLGVVTVVFAVVFVCCVLLCGCAFCFV
jgi:hypothetical protein